MVRKAPNKKAGDKRKILVVDDQVGIVSFLHDFFRDKGYEVLQATNAKKAITQAKKEKPDLVLLDIHLGKGEDGIKVLEEIKAMMPRVKVLMITAIKDQEVMNEAFRLGADDYISKPFSLQYLEKVVMLKVLSMDIDRIGKG
ncbi:MAG: response regulator [Candidatus Omnitrophota bacterium]|jgi:DNA-binding response OmpR family regulator